MTRQLVRNFNSSLNFNGTSNTVTTTLPANFTGAKTFAAWIFRANNSANHAIVGGVGGNNLIIRCSTADDLVFWADGGFSAITWGNCIPLRKWIQMVVVYDLSNVSLYLNGVLISTQAYTQAWTSFAGAFTIGSRFATDFWAGYLDDIRVYNTALTAAQVASLFYRGQDPVSPLAKWLLNEGSGTTAIDTSGNGYTGTITGATYSTNVPMIPRSAASGRLMNREMKSSLSFAGAGYAQLPVIPTTTGLSISAWIKTPTPIPVSAIDIAGRSAGTSDVFEITGNGELRLNIVTSGGTCNVLSGFRAIPKDTWCHVAGTYDITTGVGRVYVNGVSSGTTTAGSGTMSNNANTWLLGALTTVTRNFVGNIVDVRMWDGALTATQVLNIYQANSEITTSPTLVAKYTLDQGAGNPIDTSGKGYNATSITAVTYVLDTPFYKRQVVNQNLVKNGDFEYAPPFTAAQNTGNAFIDGTAGGTVSQYTRRLFPWAIANAAIQAGATVRYDPTVSHSGSNSLLLASNDATGTVVCLYGATNAAGISGADFENTIKVLPSTSYILTAWVKTVNIPTNGVYIDIRQFTNAGTNLSTTSTSKLTGTNDWTQLSLTFTTGATASNATIILRNGVAGNINSAWFDDIVLTPTTATTRLTA